MLRSSAPWALCLLSTGSLAFQPLSPSAPQLLRSSALSSLSSIAPPFLASKGSARVSSRRLSTAAPQLLSSSITMNLGKKSTAKEVVDFIGADLTGKTALVTGANSGIGTETVKALASAGCRVIMAARNVESAEKAIAEEIKAPGVGGYKVENPNVEVLELDLADLESVERAAQEFMKKEERLDFLVLNAGVMALPLQYTKQNFEMQIGVNHFGHFHLTQTLLPFMKKQDFPSRVVTLSSIAHEQFESFDVNDLHYVKGRAYSPWPAYGQSKLANMLFTKGLHNRLLQDPDNKVTALAVHPGVIKTNLWRHQGSLFSNLLLTFIGDKSIPQGAATSVYACLAPGFEGYRGGAYLSDCKVREASAMGRDPELREKFWETTEAQIAEVLPGKKPSMST